MAGPKKLLVALTHREAERTRDALELSRNEWEIGSFLASYGTRFDKIVAILPPLMSDVRHKDAVQHIRTWLTPAGELIFL